MKYNGKSMKDLVDREDWQELRESFLGTWNNKASENVKKLRAFLGSLSSADPEKLLIVFNYLTGTAFRIGIVKTPEIEKFRTELQEEILLRKQKGQIKVTRN